MTKHQSTHELEPATLVPAQGELRGHTTPEQISDDTPLRLEAAAAIAFPDGGMTANGLRVSQSAVVLSLSESLEKIIRP
jgi:hypothetical protein